MFGSNRHYISIPYGYATHARISMEYKLVIRPHRHVSFQWAPIRKNVAHFSHCPPSKIMCFFVYDLFCHQYTRHWAIVSIRQGWLFYIWICEYKATRSIINFCFIPEKASLNNSDKYAARKEMIREKYRTI